jgi:PHD/YefM family antitoxin component YafN of YafNO toxin-antitoxin module
MLDISQDIHSLSSFKRKTGQFVQQLKDTGRPVVLTINGQAELVVQDAAAYQQLLDLAERARAIEAVRRGLEDVAAGRTQPAGEAFEEIRRELQIPRETP